jgi:hypothetical protein
LVFAFFPPSLHIIASELRQQGDRSHKVKASKLSQTLNPQTLLLKANGLGIEVTKNNFVQKGGYEVTAAFWEFYTCRFCMCIPRLTPSGGLEKILVTHLMLVHTYMRDEAPRLCLSIHIQI